MSLRALMLCLAMPLLMACATQEQPPTDPGIAPPAMGTGSGDIVRFDDAVDYSCNVDSDCAVKNVGNCCGYYPACVNVDSPTFPELVQARCQESGMMSVCGFAEISACQCIDNRCEAAGQPGGPGLIR